MLRCLLCLRALDPLVAACCVRDVSNQMNAAMNAAAAGSNAPCTTPTPTPSASPPTSGSKKLKDKVVYGRGTSTRLDWTGLLMATLGESRPIYTHTYTQAHAALQHRRAAPNQKFEFVFPLFLFFDNVTYPTPYPVLAF